MTTLLTGISQLATPPALGVRRGAAMAELLITDGASPLYRAGDRSLRFAIRSTRLALDPVEQPVSEPSLA